MYKKAWCTCKIVVLVIKPIAFMAFPLPSPSSDLKVPIISQTTRKFITFVAFVSFGTSITKKDWCLNYYFYYYCFFFFIRKEKLTCHHLQRHSTLIFHTPPATGSCMVLRPDSFCAGTKTIMGVLLRHKNYDFGKNLTALTILFNINGKNPPAGLADWK